MLLSNSVSGDPARGHSPRRVPAAGRGHTCHRLACPVLEASTPHLPLVIRTRFNHFPVKGKRIYQLNSTLLHIFLPKEKSGKWEDQLQSNRGGAFPSGRKQPSQFVLQLPLTRPLSAHCFRHQKPYSLTDGPVSGGAQARCVASVADSLPHTCAFQHRQ